MLGESPGARGHHIPERELKTVTWKLEESVAVQCVALGMFGSLQSVSVYHDVCDGFYNFFCFYDSNETNIKFWTMQKRFSYVTINCLSQSH